MTEDQVDWSKCPLVEFVPGKVSGAPVLKATRMPVQTIVDNYDAGMMPAEIAEAWDVDLLKLYKQSWNIARISLPVLLDDMSRPASDAAFLSTRSETVAAKGWSTLSNGNLLQAAEKQIDVLVTCDQNIVHQQNIIKNKDRDRCDRY